MKYLKIFSAAAMLMVGISANAQELVIRIDDMGALHSVNTASIDTYRNGIAGAVEVLAVGAWFPEAVKMLKENPGLDVGIHLAITSEWENVKWRPLTNCPSLVDENGYFFPMMGPNPAYPGQSVIENAARFDIREIEQEFRAQIELALKNIPQITHISGHMMSTGYSPEVLSLVQRLSEEYGLPSIDRAGAGEQYGFEYIGYDGAKATSEEKIASFIRSLDKMEKGKRYVFIDHPAYNDSEMQTVMHIGYEDVAVDRQGVTDLLKSPEVRKAIEDRGIRLIDFNYLTKQLPRAAASEKMKKASEKYLAAVAKEKQDLHSIMVVKDGNVVFEKWMSEGKENEPHILNSISKTFTSMAVGFAISEGLFDLDDKVADIFPEYLPENPDENVKEMTVRHLLTMNCGHSTDPTRLAWSSEEDWRKVFLSHPVTHKPGTIYCYNSLGTYMLSAIVQKYTGEKLTDYLYPRLFRPLGINNVSWAESAQGINTGGWGLYLKTEDLAKMGQMLLQKGKFNGRQVVPEWWIEEASAAQVQSVMAGINSDMITQLPKNFAKTSDWLQGYGYQMWRCRHNAFRADGANGQYIIVIPDKNAVVVTTANITDMQGEINLIWKYILPAL